MKTNTFKKALDQGVIKGGDHFLVKYPDGMEALFRLLKTEKGYVMWGPPTVEEVLFKGKEGYDHLFELADSQARKEYANDVFQDIHACSLPEREYQFETYNAFLDALYEFRKKYDFSDTSMQSYALASRCVHYDSNSSGSWFDFRMFRVYGGSVNADILYGSTGGTSNYSYAVRPEAIPKSTMEFIEEDCDGSEERPWICLGSQEREEFSEQSKGGTSTKGEDAMSTDKEELMSFIQEGYNWLKKLEERVQNLK